MSLSPHERQTLTEIESQLISCDPKLAAMLKYWTVTCVRLHAILGYLKRLPGHGERARLFWTLTGLSLIIGLAIAGALTTHSDRPPGRGPRSVSRMVPVGARLASPHPASPPPPAGQR